MIQSPIVRYSLIFATFVFVWGLRPNPSLAAPTATILFQGFEAGDSWGISAGSTNISAATGSGDAPANQRILNGSNAWQVNNAIATLDLIAQDVSNCTGVSLTVRVSSTSATSGNGADGGDSISLFVDTGSGFPATADIQLTGKSNARWGYDATLTATTDAGTPVSQQAPQGGTNTNNYSTLVVNIDDATNSVALRVVAINNDSAEFWNVDDILLDGTCVEAAPNITSTTPANGAENVASDAAIMVTFNEAVSFVSDVTITCTSSGTQTVTPTGGATTWTLPHADFAEGENCTVTIEATDVTDNDSDDPPDNMASDYTFSFTVDIPLNPTTLTDGDVAIIGYNSANPDQFAFVILAEIGNGTEIRFTDKGWQSSGSFRTGEGVLTWTADRTYPFGWIFVVDNASTPSVSAGNIAKSAGTFGLSESGDQIIVYQETAPRATTFLYAIQMNGSWDSNADDPETSAQPTGLTNFVEGNPEVNNAVYDLSVTSGSKATLLAAIADFTNNWNVSDASRVTMPTADTTSPTSVTLNYFNAVANSDSSVTLNWETAQEKDHAGFYIYRRAAHSRDAWLPVNSELIASRGTQGQGAVYQYTDNSVPLGAWEYLLEDVENDGDTFRHIEFIAMVSSGVPTAISLIGADATPKAEILFGIVTVFLATLLSLRWKLKE